MEAAGVDGYVCPHDARPNSFICSVNKTTLRLPEYRLERKRDYASLRMRTPEKRSQNYFEYLPVTYRNYARNTRVTASRI